MSEKLRQTRNHPPANVRMPYDRGDAYTCQDELRRPPGVPDARFAAFNLPSLINGERVYPKRSV